MLEEGASFTATSQ
jgi:hypothetical protein